MNARLCQKIFGQAETKWGLRCDSGGFFFDDVFDIESLDENDEAGYKWGGDEHSEESNHCSENDLGKKDKHRRKFDHFSLDVGCDEKTFEGLDENEEDGDVQGFDGALCECQEDGGDRGKDGPKVGDK